MYNTRFSFFTALYSGLLRVCILSNTFWCAYVFASTAHNDQTSTLTIRCIDLILKQSYEYKLAFLCKLYLKTFGVDELIKNIALSVFEELKMHSMISRKNYKAMEALCAQYNTEQYGYFGHKIWDKITFESPTIRIFYNPLSINNRVWTQPYMFDSPRGAEKDRIYPFALIRRNGQEDIYIKGDRKITMFDNGKIKSIEIPYCIAADKYCKRIVTLNRKRTLALVYSTESDALLLCAKIKPKTTGKSFEFISKAALSSEGNLLALTLNCSGGSKWAREAFANDQSLHAPEEINRLLVYDLDKGNCVLDHDPAGFFTPIDPQAGKKSNYYYFCKDFIFSRDNNDDDILISTHCYEKSRQRAYYDKVSNIKVWNLKKRLLSVEYEVTADCDNRIWSYPDSQERLQHVGAQITYSTHGGGFILNTDKDTIDYPYHWRSDDKKFYHIAGSIGLRIIRSHVWAIKKKHMFWPNKLSQTNYRFMQIEDLKKEITKNTQRKDSTSKEYEILDRFVYQDDSDEIICASGDDTVRVVDDFFYYMVTFPSQVKIKKVKIGQYKDDYSAPAVKAKCLVSKPCLYLRSGDVFSYQTVRNFFEPDYAGLKVFSLAEFNSIISNKSIANS